MIRLNLLIVIFLSILIPFFNLPAEQTNVESNNLNEYVQIAIQSRAESVAEALQGRDPKKKEIEAAAIIWEKATDFSKEGSLAESVRHFIESTLQIEVGNFKIFKDNSIFIANEQNVVVKVYSKRLGSFYYFVREISGNDLLSKQKLDLANHVKMLAVGKCVINGTEHMLLAMTIAPGKEISKYVLDIFESKDRQAAIEKTKRVFSRLGHALGELHAKSSMPIDNPSEETAQLFYHYTKGKIEKNLDEYKKNGGGDYEKIDQVFRDKMKYYHTPRYKAISHGDAHLENFFYDETSDRITIIDTERMHLTIDSLDAPLTAGHVQDIARVQDDIYKWVLAKEVNDPLIQELAAAFRQGYDEAANAFYTPAQFAIEEAVIMLARLKAVVNWERTPSEEKRIIEQRIYETYLNYFLVLCNYCASSFHNL